MVESGNASKGVPKSQALGVDLLYNNSIHSNSASESHNLQPGEKHQFFHVGPTHDQASPTDASSQYYHVEG